MSKKTLEKTLEILSVAMLHCSLTVWMCQKYCSLTILSNRQCMNLIVLTIYHSKLTVYRLSSNVRRILLATRLAIFLSFLKNYLKQIWASFSIFIKTFDFLSVCIKSNFCKFGPTLFRTPQAKCACSCST